MTHKMRAIIILVVAICLVLSWPPTSATENDEQQEEQLAIRSNWKVPQVFNFQAYKENFGKHYKSALEEAVRVKVFLARAYRAFISAIKYKFRQATYFLAVNSRSDWTREERDLSRMQVVGQVKASDEELTDAKEEFFEPSELEAELERIESRAHEPGYAQLAVELERVVVQAERRRTKRDLSSAHHEVRNFDVLGQSLERPRPPRERPARRAARVVSNNPNYKPLELMSQMSLAELASREDYKPVLYKKVRAGKQARTYDHLPVKGQHKLRSAPSLYSMTSNLVWGLVGYLSSGGEQEEVKEPSEPDIVWVDHRRSNCLAPIQEQGKCGSCYAFSSIALLEWTHCMESGGGSFIKFSEQYVIDCGIGRVEGLEGCRSGLVNNLAIFYNNFGLELRSHYPYLARQEACPYAPDTPMSAMGYLRPDVMNFIQVPVEYFEEHLNNTPLVVNLHTARTDFDEYGGGVWDGKNCEAPSDHSTLLIGHGREDGEEYWLIRNSYSTDYGEQGYLKLNKNSNCIQPQFGFLYGRMRNGHMALHTERNPQLPVPVKRAAAEKPSEQEIAQVKGRATQAQAGHPAERR